jgi:hypothetical protein
LFRHAVEKPSSSLRLALLNGVGNLLKEVLRERRRA